MSAFDRLNEKRRQVSGRKDDLLPEKPALNPSDEYPEYSRVTVKMEVGVDEQVRAICSIHKLSKEAFIEASCDWVLQNPELIDEVLELARKKAFYRKKLGTKRRAKTMSDKFCD